MEAYNFRLCVTQNTSNMAPITQPSKYDPHMFELPRRYGQVAPASLNSFLGNTRSVPNSKFDMNNGGPMSTDYIGGNWEYPEANYSHRDTIWQAHLTYTQGFLWFLGHDPDLPQQVRTEMLTYGLCKDEFTTNTPPYWPEQLYIREAKRMMGDYIFIQSNATSHPNLGTSSIGMGSYNFDSHNVQRITCANETLHCEPQSIFGASDYYALNEGDVQTNPGEYQIPLDVIFPKRNESSNLMVIGALSASHVGICTLRLEPTWMIIGHSAGTAAAILTTSGGSVQNIDRTKLHDQLVAEKQILAL